MAENGKIPTEGGRELAQNPFAGLSGAGLPSFAEATAGRPALGFKDPRTSGKNRGRVDIRRETQGRSGKTVTVVDGFTGIGLPEKELLAKKIRSAAGSGGTVKEGRIEIQGDKREVAAKILTEAGFRPVFAGG